MAAYHYSRGSFDRGGWPGAHSYMLPHTSYILPCNPSKYDKLRRTSSWTMRSISLLLPVRGSAAVSSFLQLLQNTEQKLKHRLQF